MNQKADFLQNESIRIDSHNESNWFKSRIGMLYLSGGGVVCVSGGVSGVENEAGRSLICTQADVHRSYTDNSDNIVNSPAPPPAAAAADPKHRRRKSVSRARGTTSPQSVSSICMYHSTISKVKVHGYSISQSRHTSMGWEREKLIC